MKVWSVTDLRNVLGGGAGLPLCIHGRALYVVAESGYLARLEACRTIQARLGRCIDPPQIEVRLVDPPYTAQEMALLEPDKPAPPQAPSPKPKRPKRR